MCLDVSFATPCNHSRGDFYGFLKERLHAAHIHMGDAKGVNEGLQIGVGDIDFSRVGEIYRSTHRMPAYSAIGHKDQGLGFWEAFERLKGDLRCAMV